MPLPAETPNMSAPFVASNGPSRGAAHAKVLRKVAAQLLPCFGRRAGRLYWRDRRADVTGDFERIVSDEGVYGSS
jgi:hypothetical protein